MRKFTIILCLLVMGILQGKPSFGQANEIAQLLLNVEKLTQFKAILKQMKDGYKILNGGYNTVKDLSQGNFSLHQTFLDGLMEVSPTVKKYRKVSMIIEAQLALVKEYKSSFSRFKSDGSFNTKELDYMEKVYGNLLKLSLRNLDELAGVITAGKMRMSDDERLQAIDHIYEDMEEKIQFLRHFNSQTSILGLQRAKAKKDLQFSKQLNGITK
ncbi:TerB family tellurite resistance protein [Sphingobacterium sp. UGAL515B_05]|uniref:TerB family tellurite resistance protein n=1 Tax=Sphingobacterium sp. UGAL515B_05 TaxID=2986767 RepID=UPI002952CC6A|nr:TerB family tellurite resistance protein [Sphingobacterium sp. UGAL515B_05]WON93761.1 TerB family tellurite resistance protein [Sphingobacterium sp. UGAL515B_05]